MEYTKGAWVVAGKKSIGYTGYHIYDNTQGILTKDVAIVYPNPQGKSDYYGEANARRIVDCVNGCEGLNPKAVHDLYKVCKSTLRILNEVGFEASQIRSINTARLDLESIIAKAEGGQ